MIKEILIKIGHIILTGDIKLYRNNMGDDIDDENNEIGRASCRERV